MSLTDVFNALFLMGMLVVLAALVVSFIGTWKLDRLEAEVNQMIERRRLARLDAMWRSSREE